MSGVRWHGDDNPIFAQRHKDIVGLGYLLFRERSHVQFVYNMESVGVYEVTEPSTPRYRNFYVQGVDIHIKTSVLKHRLLFQSLPPEQYLSYNAHRISLGQFATSKMQEEE